MKIIQSKRFRAQLSKIVEFITEHSKDTAENFKTSFLREQASLALCRINLVDQKALTMIKLKISYSRVS
ncbi:hypothetical protein [uncultured Campylobacter sp.]|uniref:hypothetical protein n=1 Tax=uncultured Campylobacter sp. TaxID=218934 RepID=UPI002631E363|nr:hypothetical protein [uncultured Campylobacter sp.]